MKRILKKIFSRGVPIKNLSFVLAAVLMLWLKTYIVYKVCFGIQVEPWVEKFILIINPLSFLLIVLGVGLFLRGKGLNRYVIFTSFVISFVLYANVVFYREFTDFITIPLILQASSTGGLGSSIIELLHISDLLFFIDVVILILISKYKSLLAVLNGHIPLGRISYFALAATIAFFNISLAQTQRPELLTRAFDREMLIKYLGTYNFHIYDVVLQTKTNAKRAFADSLDFVEIEDYLKENRSKTNPELFGIAKDRNVIIISMESIQSFVINNYVDEHEVTPFLNELIKESYYFDNFYHQTAQGKSADSELLLDTSLYPLGRGAAFFTHATNKYIATPNIIKDYGYHSSVFHANNKSFWNRDIMYDSLGYDHFYALPYYEVDENNSIGWGLKDAEFFEQTIELMKTLPTPYYTKLITLTNHFPFELEEEDKLIPEYWSNSRTLNRYVTTVRYMDEALKHFFDLLKEEGMYEDSIFIMYGDHNGISENHNRAMGMYLDREITPLEIVQLQRVPMFIHIPGVTDVAPEVFSGVSGQIDLKPTILHLMGINTKGDLHFGTDLLAEDRTDFVVLRDGSFITKDYVYTKGKSYDKITGLEIDQSIVETYMDRAIQELFYSDQIIYGDLLRFYDINGSLEEETNR